MKCSENLQQKIEALAAGELNPFVARGVERHVEGCAECAARLASARALLADLKGLAEEMPSDNLRERVFAKMGAAADSLLPSEGEGPGVRVATIAQHDPAPDQALLSPRRERPG